jgi:hypothetical protein
MPATYAAESYEAYTNICYKIFKQYKVFTFALCRRELRVIKLNGGQNYRDISE